MAYGYRVHGPYKPEEGHRFNAHKLLVDPYAKDLVGQLRWGDALYGYTVGGKREDLSFDRRDSAAFMPKGRVLETAFTWGDDRRPSVPWQDMVIYEMHVRGFTMRHPDVPSDLRGTYAALGCAPVVDYLKRLGVTTVELLPVHSFINDRHLAEQGLQNYWGYNTLGFFAPEMRYSASGKVKEFKTMVKTLHSAGIEVILDVVYNHTCEGNQLGPTLSMRGVDNASYYIVNADNRRYYDDFTGCGNTVNLEHRACAAAGDGLAALLGRGDARGRLSLRPGLGAGARVGQGGEPGRLLRRDQARPDAQPRQAHRRAVGPGPRRLPGGQLSAGWAEWNDRYRDGMRGFWKGDGGLVGEVASASPAPRICTAGRASSPARASTSSPRTTASRCTTWCRTTTSTTRPTARTTATATATTCRGTAAWKAPPTTPRS
jgi:isoamylase